MVHTEIQANVTYTAVFTGAGVSIASLGTNWTLKLQVSALTAGAIARFVFEESPDGFTTVFAGPVFEVQGGLTSNADIVQHAKWDMWPGVPFGTAGESLRLHLTKLTAASSVTYHAWSES